MITAKKGANMLLTIDDANFLATYLELDEDPLIGNLKIAVEDISKEDIEKLLLFDKEFVWAKGYHLISDYKKLIE